MVPWYIFLGRPLMKQDTATEPRATIYLAGLVVLFAIAQSQAANAWFLAFGLAADVLPRDDRAPRHGVRGDHQRDRRGALDGVARSRAARRADRARHRGLRGRVRVRVQPLDGPGDRAEPGPGRAHRAARGDPGRTRRGAPRGLAVQAERHRLAYEIHDTLAQGFTSIVTLLQAYQVSLDAASPARRHLDLALLTARENLAEARTLVTALTPATLEAGTLGDTVRRVTSATGAQA